MTPQDFYKLSIPHINGTDTINFSEFHGKKVLLVNVASKCGYTYQYKGLQSLHEQFSEDLVVIGFPCNQFLFQEPGSDQRIDSFCKQTYNVEFLMSTKIKVKGDSIHPVYDWLTRKEYNGKGDYKVSWNFNKFLVNENGELTHYFDAKVKPKDAVLLEAIKS
ncbi:MAG: glutathione peroxidase [Bacteroidia bacterium]